MVAAKDREEAIAQLRKLVKPGARIYSVIRSVSKSGMSRNIDFYVVMRDGKGHRGDASGTYLQYLTGYMAHALEYSLASQDGSKRGMHVRGCGMDMAFHCVDYLDHVLWPSATRKASQKALKSEVL